MANYLVIAGQRLKITLTEQVPERDDFLYELELTGIQAQPISPFVARFIGDDGDVELPLYFQAGYANGSSPHILQFFDDSPHYPAVEVISTGASQADLQSPELETLIISTAADQFTRELEKALAEIRDYVADEPS